MLTFACKDTGGDCDFVAMCETVEEVKEKVCAHVGVVHDGRATRRMDQDGGSEHKERFGDF